MKKDTNFMCSEGCWTFHNIHSLNHAAHLELITLYTNYVVINKGYKEIKEHVLCSKDDIIQLKIKTRIRKIHYENPYYLKIVSIMQSHRRDPQVPSHLSAR